MTRHPFAIVAAVLAATAVGSCSQRGQTESAASPGTAQPNNEVPQHQAPAGHGHAEHREEGGEPGHGSDLDRPVEELFAATCEHAKKTFECVLCRYEVGVVRASQDLIREGLFQIAKATRRRVAAPVTLTGEVRFDERRVAHLAAQTEGIVKRVHVTLGDKVKKGQSLIELESVALGEAQAEYLESQARRELAHRNYERVAALRKENIASEKEYLMAREQLESAKIHTQGALGKLVRMGMSHREAKGMSLTDSPRGRLVLRSPADGSVLLLHAVPGELAKPQESLLTVGDNDNVWVWANLYERDIATVAEAQSRQPLAATVLVKAYPRQEFAGTVNFLSPAMDESSRTVKVRVAVKNPDRRLLAGMFASVKLYLPGTDSALAIPKAAVLEDEGRHFVFVHHHDAYYVRRPIAPGRSWATFVEVLEGLSAGQLVVADGAFLMKSDVLRSKMGAGCAD